MTRVTELAQARVTSFLREGDFALDATAGNGHDTALLAAAVGETGRIWACDVQAIALERTHLLLASQGLARRVELVHAGHETLANWLPKEAKGLLKVAMFNLGYLPSGDKGLTTHTASTLDALTQALACLAAGGALSVICYPGHPTGAVEAEAVEAFLAAQPGLTREVVKPSGTKKPSPFWIWAVKA